MTSDLRLRHYTDLVTVRQTGAGLCLALLRTEQRDLDMTCDT